MFQTFIVQPIFNVLSLVYAVVPGHDFGVAVILFTILVRVALWPLLKKQLHQTKLMREMQPEIKKIKARTKGDRQKEAALMLELYKERGASPYGTIGIMFLQFPILIGLFQGLRRLAESKDTLLDLTYSWVQNIGWLREVKIDINSFDERLLGLVDLTRSGFGEAGVYWPVIALALLAAVMQFYQTKQLQPKSQDARKIRDILRDESRGKSTDQSEINAAVAGKARFFFPVITFFFASSVPGALALYWATGSLVAVVQQRSIFKEDVEEMEDVANKPDGSSSNSSQPTKTKTKKKASKSKRKKR
jgi:YidC/Oxa1 family membrane protein insertase